MWAFIVIMSTLGSALVFDVWWVGAIWGFVWSAGFACFDFIRWVKAGRP